MANTVTDAHEELNALAPRRIAGRPAGEAARRLMAAVDAMGWYRAGASGAHRLRIGDRNVPDHAFIAPNA